MKTKPIRGRGMTASEVDRQRMLRAMSLAGQGLGFVEPNPMVGAVVVSAQGEIVGEGWHEGFGGAHAEVNALNHAGEQARGGTLYATLEPCCHHGKTPPCTEAIIRAGIGRVVVALPDPFPEVNGGGIRQLQAAGIEVEQDVAIEAVKPLYGAYLKLIRTGTPWIIAKWAMTLDGKIATSTGESKWITGERARQVVHELRGRMDAIMVGAATLRVDDPLLTARPGGPRVATRVVVTGTGELPTTCQLLLTAKQIPVIAYTQRNHNLLTTWREAGVEIVLFRTLRDVLLDLGRRRFTNVLVEGGAGLLGSLLDADAIDVANVFIAPKLIGGAAAPSPIAGLGFAQLANAQVFDSVCVEQLGPDLLVRARRNR